SPPSPSGSAPSTPKCRRPPGPPTRGPPGPAGRWGSSSSTPRLPSFSGTLAPEVQAPLGPSSQGARGDGGALVFLFETPAGSLFYQDTSGHWSGILRDLRPDVDSLAAEVRRYE